MREAALGRKSDATGSMIPRGYDPEVPADSTENPINNPSLLNVRSVRDKGEENTRYLLQYMLHLGLVYLALYDSLTFIAINSAEDVFGALSLLVLFYT